MKLSFKTADGRKSEAKIVGNRAIVGRSTKCDAVVTDESLSRQHCLIEIADGEFFITDLKSANGVSIDGNRIQPDVRTRFASFSSVSLGTVECQVEDSENTNLNQFQSTLGLRNQPSPPIGEGNERPTKRLNRDALNKPLKMKNESKEGKPKKFNAGMLLALGAFVVAALFFFQDEPEIEAPVVVAPVKKERPKLNQRPMAVDNDLRTDAEYITNKTKGNCSTLQFFCDQLRIDGKLQETIFQDGLNYIIYLSPSRLLEKDEFRQIRGKSRAQDFVALLTIFNSGIMEEYMMKRISSIHVVIMDANGKLNRVYLISTKAFNPDTVPRIELMTAQAEALSSGNLDAFWSKAEPFLNTREITE